jgi:hypothetical protein
MSTMTKLALLIALLAIAALAAFEHKPLNDGLPLAKAAYPLEHRDIIPWTLNTRCTITNENLPKRQPEHQA